MPNLELWIALALIIAGLVVGAVTLYRARANRKTDAEVAAEWEEADALRGYAHDRRVYVDLPPTPGQD